MDFNDTPQEAEFRKKVRSFLEANAEKRSTLAAKPKGGVMLAVNELTM